MNALILLGGGVRGAYQVGVIRSIRELRVPIDIHRLIELGYQDGKRVLESVRLATSSHSVDGC